jgi:predicted membrane protein DUF2306
MTTRCYNIPINQKVSARYASDLSDQEFALCYETIADRKWIQPNWMTLNFSLTLAGVMLSLWVPVMVVGGIPFDAAYLVVAWLCWVPNLVVAEAIFRASLRHATRPAAATAATG